MANNALGLDGIRLSALTKASVVGKFVRDVTLGPNSKCADYDLLKNRSEVKCELGENFPPLSTKNSHASGDARNCNMNSCIDNVECAGGEDYSSLSTMKLLYDLDQQRQRKVKDLINERFRNMMKDSQIRQLEFDSKHQYLQHEIQAKVLQDEQLILRQLQEDEILADQRQQQLAQQHKKHTQRINELNEKIKEAERQKEAEEEERKIIKERKIQIDKVHHYYIEYRTKCEQIVEASRQCKDKQAFVAEFSDYASKLKSLNVAMDQLVGQCK
ncbi:putative cyclin-dependent serine/threonine-protein kinase DDB_G0272797/DDB_G0274007, partial [Zootermopsis nevadensis]|uniref:putative cyclin-dependent serine/threonine-protein kinase DDB_G0272797/DDB_G0274007 n=1 Tax=Zootermopsis nevadensis TaxID=136037 RepID=UPI000B8EBB48